MKSIKALKIGASLPFIMILCLLSIKTFALKNIAINRTHLNPLNNKNEVISNINYEEDVTITIDKNTSEKDFEDIKNMLIENGITGNFNQIKRNNQKEIIGIQIELSDSNNNKAVSNISSQFPIGQITFGRKDGQLFISSGAANSNLMSLLNQSGFNFNTDSIPGFSGNHLGNFNFNDFFNDDNGTFFFNGQQLNLDELRKQFEEQFDSEAFSSLFNPEHGKPNQFRFTDDPNTNKLIIIDGKESDFKTLDQLAKENKLKAVDNLKPKTAMSIYGDKAKDGAVIATTK
ncbi:hypothetical protein [Aestuariibaculum sediminum]|uniref:Uncharacterized protein n=1 Tax=Aestuariibaculum sediminum TaxID=2770637 RepID=A0A8J6UGF0_9FLAO|nr:hypothetical protein [Aestuariibaculum sediminum]MBD0832111.1 hypothetical protein [Aestuariibaculum sediminum]